jgi:GT2 family glycosyltransferase
MVGAMVENKFDACGGPNYAPHEESRTEACVAVSPGAPCHVLIDEDRAEHLAGCNMVFRKSMLTTIGGFDPQFTAAGDDVDICWRAIDAGFTLGFCPAAFVWHFRRNTVKAYYGQQRGYGKAEAMLYFKYPERFNSLGQIMWRGRIPGLARMLPGGARKKILWATGSRAFFQTIYEREQGLIKFLPQTLEWQLWRQAGISCRRSQCSPLARSGRFAMPGEPRSKSHMTASPRV